MDVFRGRAPLPSVTCSGRHRRCLRRSPGRSGQGGTVSLNTVVERRFVIITGAGASTALGAGSPLPMMAEWSSDVRGRINGIEQGLAETIGLQADMLGDVFEDRLGLFLEWKATLPLVRKFEDSEVRRRDRPTNRCSNGCRRNEQRASAILETIHLSLYENFNASRLDHDAGDERVQLPVEVNHAISRGGNRLRHDQL